MKKTHPKVKISICIPTFNRADLLEKTILSCLNQTQKPFEILVVDNHSTDTTKEVAEKYKKKGIKYFRNRKNLGIVGNWNKCIEYAKGNYITILHSDDLLSPLWHEVWTKIIAKNPTVDGFFSSWAFLDINDNITNIYQPLSTDTRFAGKTVIQEFYKRNILSPQFSGDLIVKKNLFLSEKIGKFRESLQTESDLGFIFPLMLSYSLYYHNNILFGHRIHENQAVDRGRVKHASVKSNQKIINTLKRCVLYLKNFYYHELVPVIGPYDVFYKKLLITYQLRSLIKGITVFKKVNRIIKREFPHFPKILDLYLYPVMVYEFIQREISGRLLAQKYKHTFGTYD